VVNRIRTSLSATAAVYLGAVLGVLSVVLYAARGYSGWLALLWLVSLCLISAHLFVTSGPLGRLRWLDVAAPALLVLALSPLYLVRLAAWPVQVSSDEVAVMDFAKKYADLPHVDLFGLSDLFGDPAGQLVVWGKLGGLFGGVDLEHMRLVHALCGLLIIGISYALFRQLLPMGWAVLGSVVLGLNHALLMMSRMAMKENLPVLLEVSALTLLLFGLRRQNRFATFVGGAIAGLGVYVHYSGRLIFPLWILFLVVLAIAYRSSLGFDRLVGAAAVAVAGFALVVTPYAIAYQRAPQALKEHTQEANLLTAKGRKFQQSWVFAPTVWAGYKRNVINGLTAFNYGRQDHAWIYGDKGHGIVDPLTGALLWVGALAVLVRVVRRRGPPWTLLPLTSFLALWLIYAFVIGQAPDYSRMLIVLPFVAYLVAEAVRALAEIGQRLLSARWRFAPALPLAAGAAAVLAIGVWNGFIGWDYIDTGQKTGDDIGSTGRYVQKHSRNPKQRFFIAADETQFPYYQWGWPSAWEERIRLFAADNSQVGGVIAPSQLGQFSATAPFTVFTRNDLWSQVQSQFQIRYPDARVDRITPDGRLLAVNVT
jgi:hypothetical protein